jgi:two-component sensor histidine kinase
VIGWGDVFYFSVTSAILLLSLLGLWLAATLPGTDRWNKRFFLGYFIVLALGCSTGFAELALGHRPIPHEAMYAVLVLESLLFSVPLPMLTVYLLHCCGESARTSSLAHAALGLWAAFTVLLACIPLAGGLGHVSPDNQFQRGPLYPLLLSPAVALLLLNVAGTLRRRKRLPRKVLIGLLVALLPMTATLIANLFADAVLVYDISHALSALALYGLALSDQIERDMRRQRQIANQRASIMVLQMRPHFIFNALTSIYSLCNLDPKKARQVTADFTEYLRKNFSAVASEGPIAFTAELEHVRAYLAVEQAQFEGMLAVDFDTPHTNFHLPPLTLQPLVEHAVKHGMGPDTVPLHVSVRSREIEAGSEVIVEDDGPGFDAAVADDPSTTLANIRQRLQMMCDGALEIAPREGGGTVAKVTIPRR